MRGFMRYQGVKTLGRRKEDKIIENYDKTQNTTQKFEPPPKRGVT